MKTISWKHKTRSSQNYQDVLFSQVFRLEWLFLGRKVGRECALVFSKHLLSSSSCIVMDLCQHPSGASLLCTAALPTQKFWCQTTLLNFAIGRLIQGFAESLQHCITPQSSVTSLFRAQCLPYKEVTEIWGLMWCCKDSAKPCNLNTSVSLLDRIPQRL